jgi:DNA-binding transcriptional LysR family regulator
MATRLDPISLSFFVRVVEEATIARAAEKEHITAAAISKRLSDLEDAIGAPLLVRNNKGVEPTTAGTELLLLARRALNELDQIPNLMRRYRDGVRGLVRICASASTTTQALPRHIKLFLKQYPDVQIQIKETTSLQAIQSIAENSADIAIFVDTPCSDLETFDYHQDRLVLIVSSNHVLRERDEINFVEALDNNFIGFSPQGAINHALTRTMAETQLSNQQGIQVNTFESVSMMVSEGLGVAVIPETVARRHVNFFQIAIVTLKDAWAFRTFRLGVRSVNSLPTAAKFMLDYLRDAGSEKE